MTDQSIVHFRFKYPSVRILLTVIATMTRCMKLISYYIFIVCWNSTVAFVSKQALPTTSFRASSWNDDVQLVLNSYSMNENQGEAYASDQGEIYTPPAEENQNLLAVRSFLQESYPFFYSILELNDAIWKAIGEDDTDKGEFGFTIFVPSDAAFQNLGETRQAQLMDPRNLETTQKIAGYHVIGETVTADQLFNCGGVLTVSGEIPVERAVTGGLFGIGGQEDGGLLINKARAISTYQVGTGLVHEVDNLVSPNILWRYMDQLRIPGSK